jgi:hypothetical protein
MPQTAEFEVLFLDLKLRWSSMEEHARYEGAGSKQLEAVYVDLLKTALLGTLYSDSEEYQRVQMRRGSWQDWAFTPLTWIL